MNTIKNTIITLIFLALCLSCSQKNSIPGSADTITIKLSKSDLPEPARLSDHLKSIRLVALETIEEVLLGRIFQVDIVNDKIFVLDNNREKIFVFDQNGKFLYMFGSRGKGPGEFVNITTFSFSYDCSKVYIGDYEQKKIIEHSVNGEFIRDIGTNDFFSDFQFLTDSTIILTNLSGPAFTVFNINRNQSKILPLNLGGGISVGGRTLTRTMNNEFLYPKHRFDTIYAINKDTIYPKYVVDFGINNCTAKELRLYREAGGRTFPDNKIFKDRPWLESSEQLYFGLMIQSNNTNGTNYYGRKIFLRNNKTGIITHLATDDVFFCGSYSASGSTYSGEFVTSFSADRLIEAKEKILANKDFKYSEKQINIIKNIKEQDNPVLVLFTLK